MIKFLLLLLMGKLPITSLVIIFMINFFNIILVAKLFLNITDRRCPRVEFKLLGKLNR